MSNSEEYLDELLKDSISGKSREDLSEEMPIMAEEPIAGDFTAEEPAALTGDNSLSEDDFLHAFEKELFADEDTDAFVRQFEQELAGEEAENSAEKESAGDELFFENLDGILNSAKEEMQNTGSKEDDFGIGLDASMGLDDDVMVDTIGEESEELVMPEDTVEQEESTIQQDAEMPEEPMGEFSVSEENQKDDEDTDVQMDDDLMNLLQSDEDFSDLDGVDNIDDLMPTEAELRGDSADESSLDDMMLDFSTQDAVSENAVPSTEPSVEESSKEKKPGLLKRLSLLLFGPDEEEAVAVEVKDEKVTVLPADIEDLSDENLAILQALEGGGQADTDTKEEPVEDEKARKKREKQEKKEQKKKEKAEKKEQKKKEKENKPKKEKKPKKPKEPDNTPPLPKVPVILCFVMAGSILALVLIGTNLFGYSNSLAVAEQSYMEGDYESAFAQLSGMKIKEADTETYEKYRILANASGEYTAYQSFFENDFYDLALDSLIRAVGRCDKYEEEAGLYGCSEQLADIRSRAVDALSGFGVSEEQALALYASDDRTEYSAELYDILTEAGFDIGLDGE